MSQFAQPGIANPEDKIVWAENLGALMLFFPTRFDSKVPTVHGESDAIAAKVVRLEDGRVWENGMVFPMALVTQLKGAIPDGMVLGRVGQGDNKKGNPPWLLQPHTAEDVVRAEAWLAANPRNSFAQPQAPQGPPTPPAWGQQATPAPQQWGGQASAPAAPASGGWGAPAPAAPAQNGWGAAPAPQAGWGAPAPAAPSAPAAPPQGQFEGQWGQAAPVAAPPVSDVHPGLAAAIQAAGYPVPADQATALQMAAALGLTPQ